MHNGPIATVAFQNDEAGWLMDSDCRSLSTRWVSISIHAAVTNIAFMMKQFIQVIRYHHDILDLDNSYFFLLFPWLPKTN